METSYKQEAVSSTIETIDMALYTWINEDVDIHVTTNEGIKKVPVTWFSKERAFQIKNDKDNRDENGFLDFPIIQIERTTITSTPVAERPIPGLLKKGADYKDTHYGFWKKIKQGKTKNFANARSQRLYGQPNFKFDNPEIVNEYAYIPYPMYYNLSYNISMKAIYMQQINEMIEPLQRSIMPYNTAVQLLYHGFKYEAFISGETNFTTNSPDVGEAEKIYEAKFTAKVLGFTTTSGVNQKTPNIVFREGPAKIRIQRERVIVGDINNLGNPDTPFRE
jgi:hypothetical protein